MIDWGLDRIAKFMAAIGVVGSGAIFINQQYERLNSLASVQETTNAQLQTLQSRLEGLALPEASQNVATKKEVEAINQTTASLTTSLGKLEKQGEQVADFETRVAAIEQKISSVAPGTDSAIATEVDALSKALSDLSSKSERQIDPLVGRIETLELRLAKLSETSDRMERLDLKISELERTIATALQVQKSGAADELQNAAPATAVSDLTGKWRGNINCDAKQNYAVLFSIDSQTGQSATGKFDVSGDSRFRINATLSPHPAGGSANRYLLVTAGSNAFDYAISIESNQMKGTSTGNEKCVIALYR